MGQQLGKWYCFSVSIRGYFAQKLESGKDGQQYIRTHIGISYQMLRVE